MSLTFMLSLEFDEHTQANPDSPKLNIVKTQTQDSSRIRKQNISATGYFHVLQSNPVNPQNLKSQLLPTG